MDSEAEWCRDHVVRRVSVNRAPACKIWHASPWPSCRCKRRKRIRDGSSPCRGSCAAYRVRSDAIMPIGPVRLTRRAMIPRIVRLLSLALALLATLTSGLDAQRTVAVALGSRMRVQRQDDSKWRVGRLTGIAPDTLRLRSCDYCADDVYSLPSLSAIQVSVGQKPRAPAILTGALVGTLVGVASGSAFAWAKTRNCGPNSSDCQAANLAIPLSGAVGLVFGTAIGASLRLDDWRPAPIR